MKKIPVIIEEDEEKEKVEDEDELENLLEDAEEFSEDATRSAERVTAPVLEQNVQQIFSEPIQERRKEEKAEAKEAPYSAKTIYEEGEEKSGRAGRRIFSENRNIEMIGMPRMIMDNIRQIGMIENSETARMNEEYEPPEIEKRTKEMKMPWEQERGERKAKMRKDYE